MTVRHPAPNPRYEGPPSKSSGKGNKPIRRIVIHSTVSPTVEGGARKIAGYFRSREAGGSAHYVIDPGEVVQSAYDDVIAWHAPPNPHTLGLEMCDQPDARTGIRWRGKDHERMLRRTAKLTAELCLANTIPVRFVTAAMMRRDPNVKGITTHAETSKAFGQSTHWDPGKWPRARFVLYVRQYRWRIARARQKAAASGSGPVKP
jgi:N-acetylmuramoyl-L-alanine amidase CwlA